MKTLSAEFSLLLRPRFYRQVWRALQRDDVPGIAAEVAYYALFALFPFLLFVTAAVGILVPDPEMALGRLFILLHRLFPSAIAAILTDFLEGPLRADRPVLLSLGILGIVWAGSQGFATVLKALNRVYCAQEVRHWARNEPCRSG